MEVEIWSDIVCPWCYVGKRRFETALEQFEHRDELRVTWRSFELDPDAPRERPVDGATHLADKYGVSREQALQMHARMTDTAASEGLEFRFDRTRSGNTFDAHRLLHLAAELGMQGALKERLMRAYLTEGERIGDPVVLERLAADAGLPAAAARELLASDSYADAVRADEATAAALGIHAVPFFVVDRSFAASGAQSPEVLGELLSRGWQAQSPLSVLAEGATCGPDGC